jgi:gamma-glutamylcyclotransferase (GGCT)/AIG2-like uncharacterized protein YtfP
VTSLICTCPPGEQLADCPITIADETVWTFAYGMNMTPTTMGTASAGVAGMLRNYALEYRTFADVVPRPGSVVPGVLWRISRATLDDLDFREGYPTLYDRETVEVETAEGASVTAFVYRMTADTRDTLRRGIGARYRAMMIEGREAFGHTTDDIPAAVGV